MNLDGPMLTSDLLSKIERVKHGFGTIAAPVPAPFASFWNERPGWKQVHGTSVAEVCARGQECGEVDALYTFTVGIPIAVQTADCVPVLLARADGAGVAAAHAGWRGTRARVVQALWKALLSKGEKPQNWVAAIGPAIGPCSTLR